jgi:RNA polymerase sigma-70 factor, ECF subfamily
VDRPFTKILTAARGGNIEDRAQLSTMVYRELRGLAQAIGGPGRVDGTLSTTALVHEAWLRLAAGAPPTSTDGLAFRAYAARVMRSVLVDHARAKRSLKRGGDAVVHSLDTEMLVPSGGGSFDVLDLNEALDGLAAWDERAARLVELRFFGGLSESEAAVELGVGVATAARDWRVARAWLLRRLSGDGEA